MTIKMPDRLGQLRTYMQAQHIDAFLISSLSHIRYLFHFSGSSALAVVTPEKCALVTDNRYRDQAQRQVTNAEVYIAERSFFHAVRDKKIIRAGMKIAFEAAHITFQEFSRLHTTFKSSMLVDTEYIIDKIVMEKTPDELAKTRMACEISCGIWQEIVSMIKPGVAEKEIAAEISYRSKLAGADKDAFDIIVASGWRSALPHGIASEKKLEIGDFVVIDYGCSYAGFNSDITRTVILGNPTKKQRAMYDAVKEANERARAAVRTGMTAIELDGVARKFLAEKGYQKAFSHSLGHGLGIDVHCLPRIGLKSMNSIQVGSIITIEPGVYFPDFGGVRIEDDLYIGENDVELLTPLDRDLLILG